MHYASLLTLGLAFCTDVRGTSEVNGRNLNVPSCAVAGMGYDDPVVTSANGGTGLADSSRCQTLCASQLNCSVFTYFTNTGGCWLQGAGLTRKPMPGAIAGPRSCEAATVVAALPSSPGLSTDSATSSRFIKDSEDLWFEQDGKKHFVRGQCIACSEACSVYEVVSSSYLSSLVQGKDFACDMLEATTPLPESPNYASGATAQGTNPWAWVLGIALILCVCVGGGVYWDYESSKHAKEKRKMQKIKQTQLTGMGPGEAAPLMNSQSPMTSATSSAFSSQWSQAKPPKVFAA
eukprot:TRINITY_DN110284_c0_g1_i1.p1 TRINITY_DN110284_c0_g1~~TRINITY_DN110284_c0_g1_i1.p1  ORF type:complete len:291 (-),score=51.08 TRINITY_DN110284_c0_g1_i1:50-922(-)